MRVKLLALLTILALALTACAAPQATLRETVLESNALGLMTKTAIAPTGEMANFTAVGENEAFQLFADSKTLNIALKNKADGQILYGAQLMADEKANKSWNGMMQSGFAVEYFSDRSPMPVRVDAFNGTPEIEMSPKDAGFDAHINYADIGLAFDIQVRLTDEGITVFVPAASIKEAESIRICALFLYPFFASTRLGEKEGYMLVPEGSGALISLKDNAGKYRAPYSKRIYGDNLGTRMESTQLSGRTPPREPLKVGAAYYGMVYEKEQIAFFATIEQGQFNAELLAYPNGVTTNYNWITTRFIYREQYNMPTTRTLGVLTSEKVPYLRDVQVNYHVLTGEDAGYVGMAKVYRDKLIQEGVITQKDTAFRTRLDFLGADAEPFLLGTAAVPMTTVNQMDAILKDLRENGLNEVLAIYRGWQKGGLTENYGSGNFALEKKLGNQNELNTLAKEVNEAGGVFLLQQDLLHANPNRLYDTSTDIAKGIGQAIMFTNTTTFPIQTLYYLTPERITDFARRFNTAFEEAPMGVSLSGITNTLFSYLRKGEVHSRGDSAEQFLSALDSLENAPVALEQPFDFLWGEMDYMLDIPLYTSNYNFFIAEIPFLPLVLNGMVPYFAEYVNFQPNNREFFLKMLEYGAYPSFIVMNENPVKLERTNSSLIYSGEYSVFKEQILSYSEQLGEVFTRLSTARMLSHAILAQDVVCVTYDSGAKLIVNTSKAPYDYKGTQIPAMDYLFID